MAITFCGGHGGKTALQDFLQIPLLRYLHDFPAGASVWALRKNLTAYDAAYVALAEALDMPLLTCDANIGGAPGIVRASM